MASYVRFMDINIHTTVTNPLLSQKCSELALELKVEKSDQTKDDSSIKKGFKCIAGDDMEKFLSKKAKKHQRKIKVLSMSLLYWDPLSQDHQVPTLRI